jgi:transcriptional regulator with XRE-family HTH domain
MFYERFLILCERRNISPSAAATQAGFNKGTVSVWKKKYTAGSDVRPERDVMEKICAFFGCSEAWLLGLEEDEKKPAPNGGSERNDIDDLIERIKRADDQTIELIRRVVGYE